MRSYSKVSWLIGACLICLFCFGFYKWIGHFGFGEKNATVPQTAELSSSRKPAAGPPHGPAGESQRQGIPKNFSGVELLPKLGTPLPASLLAVLQKSENLPEIQAATLERGGKTFVLGAHSGGGQVLHLGKDNALLAFGFASSTGEALPLEERQLLTEFEPSEQRDVTVLDEKFEPISMQIQIYRLKRSPKIHALVYSKGRNRTVAFFDSTRVDTKKLLPASPETMDPLVLKQLRSLVQPTK